MATYFAIRRIAVKVGEWAKVLAPIPACKVVIETASTSALLCRTERTADNVKRLPASSEKVIEASVATFDVGDEVCELQAVSADSVAVVEWTR